MSQNPRVLVVIPARGGSKGIPKKNVRNLAGKPLIGWAIEMASRSRHSLEVVVSSEDDEILMYARHFGVKEIKRPEQLASDETTLDPVIHHALSEARKSGDVFDLVATVQATSPLLRTESFDAALDEIWCNEGIDSLISGVDDTHLTWRFDNGQYLPNYAQRLNRQQLPRTLRETGGFFITRPQFVTPTSRLGTTIGVYELPRSEAVDIDSFDDWNLCELQLRKKRLLFVVLGNPEYGMGHVYRALMLAQEFPEHSVEFLALSGSELAQRKISSAFYRCHIQQPNVDLAETVLALSPDVVLNDILDTTQQYVRTLKLAGKLVINFEDLGEGLAYADTVFNELYPEKEISPNVFSGHEYFCLRDEFLLRTPSQQTKEFSEVLLTFGGTDPLDLTNRTLREVTPFCQERGIRVTVVLGLGYSRELNTEYAGGVEVHRNTANMSELMLRADLAFTSAGRTVYELTSLAVPSVVICQNERELSHYFAHPQNGLLNLGGGWQLGEGEITRVLKELATDHEKRHLMRKRMLAKNLADGKRRVVDIIKNRIGGVQ